MENLRVLILAAGKSTRMKSKYAKVLHRAGGAALIPEAKFVDQKEQLGTGHAVLSARQTFSDYPGHVLVLPGDVPLIGVETLEAFLQFHRDGGFPASVLTADAPNPSGYGRIVRRNNNEVDSIVEHRDASPEVRKIPEINSGIY